MWESPGDFLNLDGSASLRGGEKRSPVMAAGKASFLGGETWWGKASRSGQGGEKPTEADREVNCLGGSEQNGRCCFLRAEKDLQKVSRKATRACAKQVQ